MRFFSLFILFLSATVLAQSDTDVYLFDLTILDGTITLDNKRNISQNAGYDNQPSFYNDNQVLFAKTRDGQTDIASYNVRDNKTIWISSTGQGSEYSPLKIPAQKGISAVRLDTTGLQRVYAYDFKTGDSKVILDTLIVGYHVWYNKETLVSSVLAGGRLDLVVSNLNDQTHYTQQQNIGRSLHKIPNTDLISYVSKEESQWKIKSIHPITGATEEIVYLPNGHEDYCWLLDGTIVLSKENALYQYNPKTDTDWRLLQRFQDHNLWNLTRVATNPTSTMLAVVSDISPEAIVQKQLETFNAGDLDAFTKTFSRDVVVQHYPDQLIYKGREALRKNYASLFGKGDTITVEVKNRLVHGNKVIDEEWVTKNGIIKKQLTIFEIDNGLISKMTFINK